MNNGGAMLLVDDNQATFIESIVSRTLVVSLRPTMLFMKIYSLLNTYCIPRQQSK